MTDISKVNFIMLDIDGNVSPVAVKKVVLVELKNRRDK